ncbi:MAG TPA: hypothetical protein VI454_03905 [Verrucomicrobiae bacterium]|jgi:hypothetical protein
MSAINLPLSRRTFLRSTGAGAGLLAADQLNFLNRLPRISAAEAKSGAAMVQLDPEIEPLVRLLEDTPRNKLIEEIAVRVRRGLSYREVLAALLLAGVRNIQPRPVGFKFHAVLVVNSAHLASLDSPDTDRWLPIFWALDQFKSSQARDVQEGDWTMAPVDEHAVPPAHKARAAFTEAMDNWDEPVADAAIAGLARTAGAEELFELFARYGARDFRDIGHKAIYVANSWRTLQAIGWNHAEPVLRSLAYALLERGRGANPAKNDLAPDRPWRRNLTLARKIRADWLAGKRDAEATGEMLRTLREADENAACDKVVELLNRGVSPASLYDAYFEFAGEMLMRRPGIVTLHSVTSSNALHYAFHHSGNDETRRLLLLQNAAFLSLFRQTAFGLDAKSGPRIDELEPLAPTEAGAAIVDEIFADISRNKLVAAQKTLAHLQSGAGARPFINAARRFLFLKGTDSHDYKFSSAALEDYYHVAPAVRDRYLAASVFYLRGSGSPDNSLVKRIRAALGA